MEKITVTAWEVRHHGLFHRFILHQQLLVSTGLNILTTIQQCLFRTYLLQLLTPVLPLTRGLGNGGDGSSHSQQPAGLSRDVRPLQ